MWKRLIYQLLFAMITSCGQHQKVSRDSEYMHKVYLFVNNMSIKGGAIYATINIDDSVYVLHKMYKPSSSSASPKIIFLKDGAHHLYADFGPFKRDTIFSMTSDVSLFVDMRYSQLKQPLVLTPDGITISLTNRDSSSVID